VPQMHPATSWYVLHDSHPSCSGGIGPTACRVYLYDGWVQAVEVQHDDIFVIQALLGFQNEAASICGTLATCPTAGMMAQQAAPCYKMGSLLHSLG
jgi:hypothetical protein